MKNLLLLLLLANILYYMWETFTVKPQQPGVAVIAESDFGPRLAVAATPSDAVLAVWSDSRDDVNDVYGQRIASDGALGADSVPGNVTGLRIAKSIVPGVLSLS